MKLLADLVKIESLAGGEQALAEFILEYLASLGLQPFMQENNVVVHVRGKDQGRAIVFNAHMDTVPVGNLSSWKYPPVGTGAGVCVDNKLYGLGASDDKSGIAALLLVAGDLVREQPECDVWLTFVSGEELDGAGTKSFLDWFEVEGWMKKYKSVSAVICEPTDLEEIKIGHRGTAFVGITIQGTGGHGSKPNEIKTNVIVQAYEIIEVLEGVDETWKRKYKDSILGEPSLSVTTISAGNPKAPNAFSDSCLLTLDIRTTRQLHGKVVPLLKNLLENWDVSVNLLCKETPVGATNPNEEIVIRMRELIDARLTISTGSNDLGFFTAQNIPAIVLGPGKYSTIHKANEYCEVDKVVKAAKIYKQIIDSYLL